MGLANQFGTQLCVISDPDTLSSWLMKCLQSSLFLPILTSLWLSTRVARVLLRCLDQLVPTELRGTKDLDRTALELRSATKGVRDLIRLPFQVHELKSVGLHFLNPLGLPVREVR